MKSSPPDLPAERRPETGLRPPFFLPLLLEILRHFVEATYHGATPAGLAAILAVDSPRHGALRGALRWPGTLALAFSALRKCVAPHRAGVLEPPSPGLHARNGAGQ